MVKLAASSQRLLSGFPLKIARFYGIVEAGELLFFKQTRNIKNLSVNNVMRNRARIYARFGRAD
jgi:hypothetical protein